MAISTAERAREIMYDNDRGGFTVPTAGLYPYQWNWDSAFAALGFATLDRDRAWRELETLFEGQWDDGMVPHTLFRSDDPDYFPGPSVWQSGTEPPSSGISQPPVVATVMRRLVEDGDANDRDRAAALFPAVLAWHRWFHRARDPDSTGLVAIVHPWESGRDNCPDWDIGMEQIVPPPDLEAYHRRDVSHVDADQRPTSQQYDRYLTIVKFGRDCGWDHEKIYREGPFLMADPGVQFILMAADRDLLFLAEQIGAPSDQSEIEGWLALYESANTKLWNEKIGSFCARNLRDGVFSNGITNASMLALYGGAGTPAQKEQLIAHARQILDACQFGFPSWDPRDPSFEAKRYWRGPVWMMMNWMIAKGFEAQGVDDLARRVRDDTLALIDRSGFFEYFDPITGDGCGGADFTWTAAIYLAWTAGNRSAGAV